MGSARGWPVGGGHDRAGSWNTLEGSHRRPDHRARLAGLAWPLILLLQCLPLLGLGLRASRVGGDAGRPVHARGRRAGFLGGAPA